MNEAIRITVSRKEWQCWAEWLYAPREALGDMGRLMAHYTLCDYALRRCAALMMPPPQRDKFRISLTMTQALAVYMYSADDAMVLPLLRDIREAVERRLRLSDANF